MLRPYDAVPQHDDGHLHVSSCLLSGMSAPTKMDALLRACPEISNIVFRTQFCANATSLEVPPHPNPLPPGEREKDSPPLTGGAGGG